MKTIDDTQAGLVPALKKQRSFNTNNFFALHSAE
jgi:hypothetical protein